MKLKIIGQNTQLLLRKIEKQLCKSRHVFPSVSSANSTREQEVSSAGRSPVFRTPPTLSES